MANLEAIISNKTAADTQWKEQRQAERENAVAMQDASVTQITTQPEAYARYLDLQGDNPTYSAGNIALVMLQDPNATVFGTTDRWRTQGRSVMDTERNKSVKIFARLPGRGYTLADAYDVRQTVGREVRRPVIRENSKEMEAALAAVLNYSVAPVVADKGLTVPAYYDSKTMELVINPDYPDAEAFSSIAAEIAHSRIHAKGYNSGYDRGECDLDAQSVSYILCRRFGIKRDLPDMTRLSELYEGYDPQQRRQGLDSIQEMSKQIGGCVERSITPQQRTRAPFQRPTR